MRLNLEIAGIAAFGIALLLAIALLAPTGSGAIGAALSHALHVAFGAAAWLVPVVVAIVAGIVFLEINVPRQIATLGFASLCYFCIADAFFGRSGGAFGTLLANGLHKLLGGAGANVALVVFAIAIGVWISGLSVKRTIGIALVLVARLRNTVVAMTSGLRERAVERASLKPAKPPGPTSLREAFNLPAVMPQPTKRSSVKPLPRSRRSHRSMRGPSFRPMPRMPRSPSPLRRRPRSMMKRRRRVRIRRRRRSVR